MADDRIPQAQSNVLDESGKRFTLPWFRFLAALDGILETISDGAALSLLKASNLSDVASASTAFNNIKQTASGTTRGVVQQDQPDLQAHTIAKVKDVTGRLHFVAPYAGTIDRTVTYCSGGTCTVRWYINGVAVGTTANSLSAGYNVQTHTTANIFVIGDAITYTISSASSCTEALLQTDLTRKLS